MTDKLKLDLKINEEYSTYRKAPGYGKDYADKGYKNFEQKKAYERQKERQREEYNESLNEDLELNLEIEE